MGCICSRSEAAAVEHSHRWQTMLAQQQQEVAVVPQYAIVVRPSKQQQQQQEDEGVNEPPSNNANIPPVPADDPLPNTAETNNEFANLLAAAHSATRLSVSNINVTRHRSSSASDVTPFSCATASEEGAPEAEDTMDEAAAAVAFAAAGSGFSTTQKPPHRKSSGAGAALFSEALKKLPDDGATDDAYSGNSNTPKIRRRSHALLHASPALASRSLCRTPQPNTTGTPTSTHSGASWHVLGH